FDLNPNFLNERKNRNHEEHSHAYTKKSNSLCCWIGKMIKKKLLPCMYLSSQAIVQHAQVQHLSVHCQLSFWQVHVSYRHYPTVNWLSLFYCFFLLFELQDDYHT